MPTALVAGLAVAVVVVSASLAGLDFTSGIVCIVIIPHFLINQKPLCPINYKNNLCNK